MLADRERVLGPQHPDTINTRHHLAINLISQGHETEGTTLLGQVLMAREQVLGPDHPATITARQELIRLTGVEPIP